MSFDEWIDFESRRIVRLQRDLEEDIGYEYAEIQIAAALEKAFAHGRDGLSLRDEPRATYSINSKAAGKG